MRKRGLVGGNLTPVDVFKKTSFKRKKKRDSAPRAEAHSGGIAHGAYQEFAQEGKKDQRMEV